MSGLSKWHLSGSQERVLREKGLRERGLREKGLRKRYYFSAIILGEYSDGFYSLELGLNSISVGLSWNGIQICLFSWINTLNPAHEVG